MAKQVTVTAGNTAKYKWIVDDSVAAGINLGQEDIEFLDVNGERVGIWRSLALTIQVGEIQPENLP